MRDGLYWLDLWACTYLEYINSFGETCPLWVVSFPRQGVLNCVRAEKVGWVLSIEQPSKDSHIHSPCSWLCLWLLLPSLWDPMIFDLEGLFLLMPFTLSLALRLFPHPLPMKFPEHFREGFDGDIPFRAECSMVSLLQYLALDLCISFYVFDHSWDMCFTCVSNSVLWMGNWMWARVINCGQLTLAFDNRGEET